MAQAPKKILRLLMVPLWMGLGALLLWSLLSNLPVDKLLADLASVSLWPLAVAVALDVVAVACKALKWHVLLRPLERISVLRLQGAIYAGGAVSVLLPARLDEGVRAFAAARASSLTFGQVVGSMASERLVDLFVIGVVVLALLAMLPLPPWFIGTLVVVGVLSALIGGVLLLSRHYSASSKLPQLVTRFIGHLVEGSRALARPRLLAVAALFAMGEWVMTICVAAVVTHAAGQTLPLSGYVLVTTLVFGSFAVPVTPAGIGVFEWAVTSALPALYKTPRTTAATLALVMHALLLAPMVTIGTAIIVITGIHFRDVARWQKDGDRGVEGGDRGAGGGE